MNRNILRRLQKLEHKELRQLDKADEWYCQLIVRAIAFYLGNPTPGESVDEAYARALGYPSKDKYYKAKNECGNASGTLEQCLGFRIGSAFSKLLAKFGVSIKDRGKVIIEAYVRMKDGLPEAYKRELFEFARSQNARPVVQGFERKQNIREATEEIYNKILQKRVP
jgi:hypothetical protein